MLTTPATKFLEFANIVFLPHNAVSNFLAFSEEPLVLKWLLTDTKLLTWRWFNWIILTVWVLVNTEDCLAPATELDMLLSRTKYLVRRCHCGALSTIRQINCNCFMCSSTFGMRQIGMKAYHYFSWYW